ncbi:unnamed protein product [Hymenolepis diminuta]|uniref:Spp2/MOS2 G-patch domain-containing protein n=1 Tax=Hymenolepis diminuta TaxID=6216 RepID=A0A564YGQ1_HYMDI|nr:unnamed protein product [Hymenolepis diminuta]
MNSAGKFSFGFSKTASKPKLIKPVQVTVEFETKETTVDYLTSFEDNVAKSKVIISNDGPVIPFRVSQSNIRERLKKKYIKPEPTDELTTKALEALNSENVDVDMKPTLSNTEAIIVPPKEEEENIDDADYEQIPIEQFGLALLKGMGLKEEDLKNNSTSDDYAAKVRLKGLGLGADPEVLKRSREVARRSFDKDDERLSWKVGSKCQIIFGRHNGQYGSVEGLDGDIGRVVVKLAASKRIVKVMQATVRLVTKAEFEKYGNYLNMNEAKKFKENGDLLTELKESQVNIKGGHNDAKVEEFSAKRRKEDPSYRHECSIFIVFRCISRVCLKSTYVFLF